MNHYSTLRDRLADLVDVVESALDAGLFPSVDGKRPGVMALLLAQRALAADAKARKGG